jgi:ABC-2 type transport system ATP-binding protein
MFMDGMPVVDVQWVSKSFGAVQAVKNVSFNLMGGEIFGLLGPNGAGKTTIIRLVLDIFKPDDGKIAVLGGQMDESKLARIGYMPEERGLYQDVQLEKCLVYLAGCWITWIALICMSFEKNKLNSSARACSKRLKSSPP